MNILHISPKPKFFIITNYRQLLMKEISCINLKSLAILLITSLVVTQLCANPVSGRGSGTKTNLTSTNTQKTLESQNADLIQNRVLSGITAPSQGDTYNKIKNSQTHWNRLTEWIALSNIFPVSLSLFLPLKSIWIMISVGIGSFGKY